MLLVKIVVRVSKKCRTIQFSDRADIYIENRLTIDLLTYINNPISNRIMMWACIIQSVAPDCNALTRFLTASFLLADNLIYFSFSALRVSLDVEFSLLLYLFYNIVVIVVGFAVVVAVVIVEWARGFASNVNSSGLNKLKQKLVNKQIN